MLKNTRLYHFLKNRYKKYNSNLYFEENKKRLLDSVINTIRIESPENTLDEIYLLIEKNTAGAYMRFGDGDVFLMQNKNDAYQESHLSLAKEMNESFLISQKNVLKSLAIHSDLFGFEDKMDKGNHKNNDRLAYSLVYSTFQYFIGQKIYSPIALHYLATTNPERANQFLKLIKREVKIFVGNENLDDNTFEKLFGDASYIKMPERNAYSKIDLAVEECESLLNHMDGFNVIVVAMGCSGRVFMKRILKLNKNVFLFDFGSLLDGIVGNKTRTWLKINNINYDKLLRDL